MTTRLSLRLPAILPSYHGKKLSNGPRTIQVARAVFCALGSKVAVQLKGLQLAYDTEVLLRRVMPTRMVDRL